jgi:hypothetical protein
MSAQTSHGCHMTCHVSGVVLTAWPTAIACGTTGRLLTDTWVKEGSTSNFSTGGMTISFRYSLGRFVPFFAWKPTPQGIEDKLMRGLTLSRETHQSHAPPAFRQYMKL